MAASETIEIISAIRGEIESAVDAILTAAEQGLRDVTAGRAGGADAFADIERQLCAILEACAFQDLTGQRLSRLTAAVEAGLAAPAPTDGGALLNGPALPGLGLDQAAADRLMNMAQTDRRAD